LKTSYIELIDARSKKAEKWAGERQRIFLPEPASLKNVSAFLSDAGWGGFIQVLVHLERSQEAAGTRSAD
jgi:hypothetical protein